MNDQPTMSPRSIRRLVESGRAVPSHMVAMRPATPWRVVYEAEERVGPEVTLSPRALRRLEREGRVKAMYGLGQLDTTKIGAWIVVLGVLGGALWAVFGPKPAPAKQSIWQQAAQLPPGALKAGPGQAVPTDV